MSAENRWRRHSEVFHSRAKEYDSWFDDSLLFSIETTAIRALPLSMQNPALEIGVGPGRFAETLGYGFGIDPAAAPLRIAAKRGIIVCRAIGESLPFQHRSFTTVSLFFALCFLEDPARVLAECHRVLHDNGQLIIGFVPSTSRWGINLQQKKEAGHPFYEYARFYSIEELEKLLTESGFTPTASVSTLYQEPGSVTDPETPRNTMDGKAGFVVLGAVKGNSRENAQR